MEQPTLC